MDLTSDQMDALAEVINIGVGRAASVLNEMISSKVDLRAPQVRVLETDQALTLIELQGADQAAAVTMTFSGSLSGATAIFFPPQNAAQLANVLVGGDDDDFDMDSVKIGALTEVGNIVLNSVIGSISNIIGGGISFKVPAYVEGSVQDLIRQGIDESQKVLIVAETMFSVVDLEIRGETLLVLGMKSFDNLLQTIGLMMSRGIGDRYGGRSRD